MHYAKQAGMIFFVVLILSPVIHAQKSVRNHDVLPPQKDLVDVFKTWFNISADTIILTDKPSISFLPVLGYNPSFGGIFGFNTVMGKQLGDPKNTDYSVYNLMFTYSTSGVTTLQSRHNIFRPENTWNFQGNWQFSLYGVVDHGLGTGSTDYCYSGKEGVGIPASEKDSLFIIRYDYLRLSEKFYAELADHVYVGAGINMNIYRRIVVESYSDVPSSPHDRYNNKYGFNNTGYSVNGLQLLFQYNTREHPIRSYGGMYFDFNFQYNPTWLGSSKNSSVINYDIRKYWSLSKKNPDHILALWHWATYKVSGDRPYLDLAYTGSDTYNRSGRGYTIGYFRGISYACFEAEYRYPILKNRLISGVVFTNFQTAGNDEGIPAYQNWNIGAGAGLRILFQKRSRSAVCIDFSFGQCNSRGIFFGLNDVF